MDTGAPTVVWLDEVDSTNTFARKNFHNYPDGTLIAARSQTAGRGRRGRIWCAPPGANLTATMIFKRLENGFHAGCLAGLGTLALLREVAPALNAFLKWPNDVYLEERKLAGILCESAAIEQGRVTGVVAGIGLNVNLDAEALSKIDQPANSLSAATGNEFNLDFLAKKLAELLFRYYINYSKSADVVIEEWRKANLLVGEVLTVVDPNGKEHHGVFQRIGEDGTMELLEHGDVLEFSCGDVKIDRNSVNWNRINRKLPFN